MAVSMYTFLWNGAPLAVGFADRAMKRLRELIPGVSGEGAILLALKAFVARNKPLPVETTSSAD